MLEQDPRRLSTRSAGGKDYRSEELLEMTSARLQRLISDSGAGVLEEVKRQQHRGTLPRHLEHGSTWDGQPILECTKSQRTVSVRDQAFAVDAVLADRCRPAGTSSGNQGARSRPSRLRSVTEPLQLRQRSPLKPSNLGS
jgi:hypothetical protein